MSIKHTGSEFTFSTPKGSARVIFSRSGKGIRNAPAWTITIYLDGRAFKQSSYGRQPSPAWGAKILEDILEERFKFPERIFTNNTPSK
jgi:hypothetical protein